jgi:Protein kinase domain
MRARIRGFVAIKVLHQGVAENQEAVHRFEREAQAAGRIGNDHILEVIDMGTLSNGDYFMVMEFLEGEPLSDRIRRFGRLRPEDAAPLVMQALEGLQAAHDAGIVHRDLKPDNIFVLREKAGQKDFVKLIDFGISKFSSLTGGSEMKMTRTGTVMGTPYYMSPEQASGSREADHRSDLYAIGVILYEAVTGRVPFDAATFNQLLFQIVLSDPAPPQQVVPELDAGFASLISKAMARDMEHRFQTANDMIAALNNWLHSGAAVSVPPAAAANPLVPRAPQGSHPLITPTGGTGIIARGATTPDVWAQPQTVNIPEAIPKSKSPVVVLGLVAAAALIAVAFGAYRVLLSPNPDSTAAVSAIVSQAPAAIAAPPEVHTAPAVAPPAVTPVEPVASAAASASAAPTDLAVPVQAAKPVIAPNKPIAIAKPVAGGGKPKTPTTGAAKPTAGGAEKPKPAKPAGGQVDFGY